jgi:hypothetical protein
MCQVSLSQRVSSYLPTNKLTPGSRALLQKLTASQLVIKIPRILRKPKVGYRVHKSPQRVPILKHTNSVRAPTILFLKGPF